MKRESIIEHLADYTLLERLPASNHAVVYLAMPPPRVAVADDVVVLKAMRTDFSADHFHRLAKELQLFKSVSSEFLVELLDAGIDGDRLFVVIRYYAGGSLKEAFGRLDPTVIRQCVADASRAAHLLHEVGVAHQDIRPSNILLDATRGRLAELELAKMADGAASTTLGAIGTLEFIAPEVLRGTSQSRQTDIWSLGMTLHRALTGHSALGDIPTTSMFEACEHLLHTTPKITDQVDADTRSILERCIAEEPDERYRTALEVARDLEELLGNGNRGG